MHAPTFDGKDPMVYTVDSFIADFNTYIIIKHINEEDRLTLFDTLIRRPAKRNYDLAIADATNPMTLPAAPAPGALAPALIIHRAASLRARITWLTNEYQGLYQQRAIRSILRTLAQGHKESPRVFYMRVLAAIEDAGYPPEATTALVEEWFVRGLHAEVALHVQSGTYEDLAMMVIAAENYWTAHTGYLPRFPQVEEDRQDYGLPLLAPVPRPTPTQIQRRPVPQTLIRPRQATPEPVSDPKIDDLIAKFKKLEAHFLGQEDYNNGQTQRTQYFGNRS
jgi:hypothetical protein